MAKSEASDLRVKFYGSLNAGKEENTYEKGYSAKQWCFLLSQAFRFGFPENLLYFV